MLDTSLHNSKVPIFGISRLRIGTDGNGITTLVTFMECPLNCVYCINKMCHESIFKSDCNILKDGVLLLTPQELYDRVKIDNIYFCVTDGGICFGGGEPALQWKFIKAFRNICGDNWKITIETCLHYPEEIIGELSGVIDYWIVDIKSLDNETFKKYTGVAPTHLYRNLEVLLDVVGQEMITIKTPLIPDYNDEHTVKSSYDRIRNMGFDNVEIVRYVRNIPKKSFNLLTNESRKTNM